MSAVLPYSGFNPGKGIDAFGAPVATPSSYLSMGNYANMPSPSLSYLPNQTTPPMAGYAPSTVAAFDSAQFPDSVVSRGTEGGGIWDSFFSKGDQQGWGGMALGAASGIGNMFMGMKQYGLAKETLENNKKQFAMNYEAQKKTTNASLEDRQRARVASNGGAYQSVGDYMSKNGIA